MGPIRSRGIKIAAASVDSVEATAKLKEGLHVGYPVYAELDAHKVAAEATGAHIQTGDRTFMHATCFIVRPDGIGCGGLVRQRPARSYVGP